MASPLQKRKLMAEINVVPYIDVMLVLLVIFMITAPLLTQGISVDLPKEDAAPIENTSDSPPLIISVDAEGKLYINFGDDEDKPTTGNEIIRQTRILLEAQPTMHVFVKADRAVPYGNVVGAMVVLQKAGASKIGFVTEPLDTYPIPE